MCCDLESSCAVCYAEMNGDEDDEDDEDDEEKGDVGKKEKEATDDDEEEDDEDGIIWHLYSPPSKKTKLEDE